MPKGTIYTDFVATSDLSGTDTDAVHDDTAGEIIAVTAKTAPVAADVVLIEDTEDSDAKKALTLGDLVKAPGLISGMTAKSTPVAADLVFINDSAASNASKKSTILELLGTATGVSGLSAKATPVAADLVRIDDTEAADAAKKITLTQVGTAAAQAAFAECQKTLEIAADAACAILNTTASIELAEATVLSVAGVEITTTSSRAGQILDIVLNAASGSGYYYLPVVGGNLTFNAAGEYARVKRNAADDAWVLLVPVGATVV